MQRETQCADAVRPSRERSRAAQITPPRDAAASEPGSAPSLTMPPSPMELLLALPWIVAALFLPVLLQRRPRLDENPPAKGELPLISIIVPARNEADNIAGIMATLLSSDYPRYEIILVDDRSTDGTTEIARRLTSNHPNVVRLVEGEPLPAGWVGKCWACWQGYRRAAGAVLVFTNADTRHHPHLLGHALGALRRHAADLVSVFPRQLMFTYWERVIQPHVFTAIMFRYRDGERINHSRNPRDVIANGQFIAMTRVGYEAIGGHEAVRAEVVEDLHLAQRTVALGRRLYVAYAEDLIATRMYRSLAAIVEGWSKNLANASRDTVDPWLRPFLPWLISLALLLVWVAPPLTLLLAPLLHTGLGWSLTAVSASIVFWLGMHRIFRIPLLPALLYPLGAMMTAALYVRSALLGSAVTWKGRRYGEVEAAANVEAESAADDGS